MTGWDASILCGFPLFSGYELRRSLCLDLDQEWPEEDHEELMEYLKEDGEFQSSNPYLDL